MRHSALSRSQFILYMDWIVWFSILEQAADRDRLPPIVHIVEHLRLHKPQ
jgi:hypothetical protein